MLLKSLRENAFCLIVQPSLGQENGKVRIDLRLGDPLVDEFAVRVNGFVAPRGLIERHGAQIQQTGIVGTLAQKQVRIILEIAVGVGPFLDFKHFVLNLDIVRL